MFNYLKTHLTTLLLLILVTAAIGVGVYQVQLKTNLFPRADSLHPNVNNFVPKGYLAAPACSGDWQIYGWTCDEDLYSIGKQRGIAVEIYKTEGGVRSLYQTIGPASTQLVMPGDAGVAASCGGQAAHWFNLPVSDDLRGKNLQIDAVALNQTSDGWNATPPFPLLKADTAASGAFPLSCPSLSSISLTLNPTTVNQHSPTTISFSTQNMPTGTSCSNSWNFTLAIPVNGSGTDVRTGDTAPGQDYTITCSNGMSKTAHLTVIAPAAVDGGWDNNAFICPSNIACGTAQTITRTCNSPTPANGGQQCLKLDGSRGLTESKSCPGPVCPTPTPPACGTNAVSKNATITSGSSLSWTYTYPAGTTITNVSFSGVPKIKYTLNGQTAAFGQPLVVDFGTAGVSSFTFTLTLDTGQACQPFSAPFTMINNCGTHMTDGVAMGTTARYGTVCAGGSPSPSVSPSPTSSPGTGTKSYRLADTSAGLETAAWHPYTGAPVVTSYDLPNLTLGDHEIWVQYLSKTDTKSDPVRLIAKLVQEDLPVLSYSCNLDLSRQNLKISINGDKFGTAQGKVFVNGVESEILDWKNTSVSAIFRNAGVSVGTGQRFALKLESADKTGTAVGVCQVGVSSITVGVKTFCRKEGLSDVANVNAVILDEDGNRTDEVVTIDKDGIIRNIKTKFQNGRRYLISFKAPNSLRRNGYFTAAEGTVEVKDQDGHSFVLPVGDIAPTNRNDGKINSLDQAELFRQWRNLGQSTTSLTGDFNRDGRVNSFDWACMRYDFNQSDADIPDKISNDPKICGGEKHLTCPQGNTCWSSKNYLGNCLSNDTVCAQVLATACSPDDPRLCDTFPTPCHIPPGWVRSRQ